MIAALRKICAEPGVAITLRLAREPAPPAALARQEAIRDFCEKVLAGAANLFAAGICFRWAGFPLLEEYAERPDGRQFLQVVGNGLEPF